MFEKGKNVLIVGGAGFVGSYIAEELLRRGANVIIFDNFSRGVDDNIKDILDKIILIKGDMRNIQELYNVFEKHSISLIYIEAALWFSECEASPIECMQNNFIGTQNVLEVAKEYKVSKVVFASSASMYGDSTPFPFEETNRLSDYSFYSTSKIACERLLETYYKKYGLHYAVLRYMNIYGPRQDYRRDYTGIVMKTIRNVFNGDSPVIYGTGEQTLDLVYVEDIARANVDIGLNNEIIGTFNISTMIETKLNDLVNRIINLMNSKINIIFEPAPNEIVGRRSASYIKAKEAFNYEPQVMLEEGLINTINWYIAQRKEVENKNIAKAL